MFESKATPQARTSVRRPGGGCDEGCAFPDHPLLTRLGTSLIAGSNVSFGWARPLKVEPTAGLG
jgi:hypothetical protein